MDWATIDMAPDERHARKAELDVFRALADSHRAITNLYEDCINGIQTCKSIGCLSMVSS